MFKRLSSVTAVMLAVLLVLSGCSGAGPDSANKTAEGGANTGGGTLIFGLFGEPSNLDPLLQNGTNGRTVKLTIYRGLVNYDRDGKLSMELAESYAVSPDKKNLHVQAARRQVS
ncbi:hypothetical protein LJK88_16190 [Paenibacillus sp. P26]|nr:hypothetical protein LJK88_16190 [Paenibacillus sp. P26]